MPKKAKKQAKIAKSSDSSDDVDDDFKIPKKKGHKFVISDSDDDDDYSLSKPSTSKGKIHNYSLHTGCPNKFFRWEVLNMREIIILTILISLWQKNSSSWSDEICTA